MVNQIKKIIKSFCINKKRLKYISYYKYVKKMLSASKINISDITPYEYIDTITKTRYPIKHEIPVKKNIVIQEKTMEYLHIHTVCNLIEFYCYANNITINKINSENVFHYLLIKLGSDLSLITIKDILKSLKYFGFKEINKDVPYTIPIIHNKEKNRIIKIGNYFSVENMNVTNIPDILKRDKIILLKIKDCICKGTPVLIGLEIYENFIKLTRGELKNQKYNGCLKNNINSIGLFPFIIVGYNDDEEYFKIYSGWGNTYGDNGYFKISYKTFLKDVKEIWYITNLNQIKKDNDENNNT